MRIRSTHTYIVHNVVEEEEEEEEFYFRTVAAQKLRPRMNSCMIGLKPLERFAKPTRMFDPFLRCVVNSFLE